MSGEAPSAVVVVGAFAWQNWASYEIEADYTTPADAWTVEVRNPSAAQIAAVTTGSVVQVLVANRVALKGFLERRSFRRSRGGGTALSLSGRDLAGPLTDCAPPASWTWRNLSLAAVAQKALTELGILATISAAAEAQAPRPIIKTEPGETYWQLIERHARKLRLLPWMSPDGVLHIDRPDYTSAPVATLTLGRVGSLGAETNVLEAAYTEDMTGRFSDVTVVGQLAGTDQVFGAGAAHLSGTAQDAGVVLKGLYRPTLVDDGELRSSQEATARAQWEVSNRQFHAEVLEYVVPGHGPTTKTLWTPNTQVAVRDEYTGLSGVWWIAGRRLLRDRSAGTRTSLTLRRPNTLLPAVAS